MRFGTHTEAVQAVIDFVLHGNVLREPFRADSYQDFPVRLTTSLKDVGRFRDCDHPRAEIGRDVSWDGILATDNTRLFEVQNQRGGSWFDRVVPSIQEETLRIETHLHKQLRGVVSPKEVRAIAGHLDAAMMARALLGPNHSIADKLFRAFQAFGYPCGWSGDFDERGFLVVFSRT